MQIGLYIEYDRYQNAFECRACDRLFYSQRAAQQHLVNSSNHDYCNECAREFPTWTSLQQHLKMSKAHQVVSQTFTCPIQTCSKVFQRMSEMSSHIESVHSSRSQVEHFIRANDPNGRITTKAIGYIDPDHDWSRYTMNQLGQYCNIGSRQYECPYDSCSRLFQSASNLWNHVNSSQHQRKSYHCPGCSRQYISISGMFKHWEYGCPNQQAAAQVISDTINAMRKLIL